MITLETLRFLQSDAGIQLLETLKTVDLSESNTLKLLTQLRKRYSPDNAAAALDMARLRIKARERGKLHPALDTNQMFFTADALEQASHWAVAEFHQQLFRDDLEGGALVADLGCGIGGDSQWFSTSFNTIGIDLDPIRLQIAQYNLARWEKRQYSALFIQSDLTKPLPFVHVRGAFFDPARRKDGKRIFTIKDYVPALSIIDTWSFDVRFDLLLVKLSPGVHLDELKPFGGTLQFVSVDGDLKEALLLRGGKADNGKRKALVRITDQRRGVADTITLESADLPAPLLREPVGYLYEPDPAVIRAGLLSELAQELGLEMYRLDEDIAYLTADTLKTGEAAKGLARAWIIDDWMPFNLKKLRVYLRDRGVGRVTVKKRGSPIMPEELITQLKLSGEGEERVVVLTHVMGQPAILICRTVRE